MLRLASAALAAIYAIPAYSQLIVECGPYSQIAGILRDTYAETPRAEMRTPEGVFHIFANEDTETWHITARRPSGMTCIISGGHGFELIEPKSPPGTDH